MLDTSKHIFGMIREKDIWNINRYFKNCMNSDCEAEYSWERIKRTLLDEEKIYNTQQLQAEIRALIAEFCDLYGGDLSNDAVSLLLTKLRELSLAVFGNYRAAAKPKQGKDRKHEAHN